MKIGIIGTGLFSVSIALSLAENEENKIIIWSENEKLVTDFKKTKKLNSIFKDKEIPENIVLTNSYEEALMNVEVVFLMTSIVYLESVVQDIAPLIHRRVPVCVGTKGINKNGLFVHEIVRKYMFSPVVLLNGPTFARDVANLEPYGFTLASRNKKASQIVKSCFSKSNVYIEASGDLIGCALFATLKNVYAIGSGILDGKESTHALYMTRVYQELLLILYYFYGDENTLFSLAGFGDFVLTCSSKESRNYTLGEMLEKKATKKSLEDYKKKNTLEGLESLETILLRLQKKRVKAPILECIYGILFEGNDIESLTETIMKK